MDILEDLCKHGLTLNFCPEGCTKMRYLEDLIADERRRLRLTFTKREWKKTMKNPVSRETLIAKLHQLHQREHYIQRQDNIVTNLTDTSWRKSSTTSQSRGTIRTLKNISARLKGRTSSPVLRKLYGSFERRIKVAG